MMRAIWKDPGATFHIAVIGGTIDLKVGRLETILRRELLERQRSDCVPLDTWVATQLALLSSDDPPVEPEAKVNGHGQEWHALRAELAAGVFKSRLTQLAIQYELPTELVLGPQQQQGFTEQCHLVQDGLRVPLE